MGLDSVIAIATGAYFTVALRKNGTVVAWGLNDYGQINIPAGLDSVIAIAAGDSHTVVLVEKRKTAIQIPVREKTVRTVFLSCKSGRLHFSSPVPDRTTIALFDLNGRMLFKTVAQGGSIKLPVAPANCIVLWRVQNLKYSAAGKILLRQK